MPRTQLVVPVGHDQQRAHLGKAASRQAQHIERRLIGPLQILEHDQRPRAAVGQLTQQRGGDRVRLSAGTDQLDQLPADRVREIEERTQRPRRQQRLAGALHRPLPVCEAFAELTQ